MNKKWFELVCAWSAALQSESVVQEYINVNLLCGGEAPREAGRLLYSEWWVHHFLHRTWWAQFMLKGFGEEINCEEKKEGVKKRISDLLLFSTERRKE